MGSCEFFSPCFVAYAYRMIAVFTFSNLSGLVKATLFLEVLEDYV